VAEGCAGELWLAAAPIGNPGDASARLREAIATADLIAAEDTRKLGRLAADLQVAPAGQIVSHFEGNEARRLPVLLAALREGRRVLVVTDAGTPGVSDPGHRLVRAAIDQGVAVRVLPGPSAVTAALLVSGLPADRWCFEGFLPRRGSARRTRLAELAGEPRTMVFFEAPHRLAASLADLAGAFGPQRPGAVCRELTKTYEEVRRGPLGELRDWARGAGPRGELTLVVGGATQARPAVEPGALADEVAARTAAGGSRRDAVRETATRYRVSTRAVYAALDEQARRPRPENLSGPQPGPP
jgi:16S rRNA (cytidine1402-2'-O)-methyltransferase